MTRITLLAWLLCGASLRAAPPEIANVYPDFPGFGPHIITGEGFDPATAEVWVWNPGSEGSNRTLAEKPGEPPAGLPAQPPGNARRVNALDVESQIIVAPLEGSVLWVKTSAGCSKPYLFNVAKPLWVSEETAEPGALVFVFGFGLRAEYRQSEFVLRGPATNLPLHTFVEARALRTADKRLVYFEVPADAPAGGYEVWCHNSFGGPWGWQKAGALEVVARKPAPKLFDVRRHGAKGNGLANDRRAIAAAIAAAGNAGGGIVFFPPGTYQTDTTIVVPEGVRLRGANRDSCVLQGTGEPGADSRAAWFHPLQAPTSVLRLRSGTGLESLTVQGATWQGEGGYGLVEAVPSEASFPGGGEVRDVALVDCRLRALEETADSRRPLYLNAFHAGPAARRIKLLNNEFFGSTTWGIGGVGQGVRIDIIGNTYHGGAVSDVVTLGGAFIQSLIDANILKDTPGRICLGPSRHCYLRFNEIHQASRGTWENAEEIYLFHGGVEAAKTVSVATGGTARSLADTKQNWKPGFHRESTVLITAGRGLGQYRRVVDNSGGALTVDQPWNVIPDATSEYLVSPQFLENVFFANLNNTPCRMSLWLDCIANQVEMHRDDHSKGIDLWGEDGSNVDDQGTARGLSKFFPAWYNVFLNGWMDGTALWLGGPGAHPDNAFRGYPSFGNYVVRNRIRQPHAYRTGFDSNPHSSPGITVSGGKGRAGTSHTIVSENFLASTYDGIHVGDTARKTFLLRNEFDHVDAPVTDRGTQTLLEGNRISGRGQNDAVAATLPDGGNRRVDPVWQPKPWQPDPAEQLPPLFQDVLALKILVSQPVYCFGLEVQNEARQAECQSRLERLFKEIKAYDARHGHLPQAAFYPRRPQTDPDSLRVLLGTKYPELFLCPTCSPDLQRLGLNYVWNERLNGQRLADLADPANTWLLMDFVGAHDWMTANHYCGHRGGVNILFADGTVRWSPPYSSECLNQKAPRGWLKWASE